MLGLIPLKQLRKVILKNAFKAKFCCDRQLFGIENSQVNGTGYSHNKLYWFKNGKSHRNRGPAIISFNNDNQFNPLKVTKGFNLKEWKVKEWYKHGKLHREDGPAIKEYFGNKYWYLNGELHREDGPAVEHYNGSTDWYLNGKLHREGGPAIESNENKYWYRYGNLHREDGPAITYPNGYKAWWLNGKKIREMYSSERWESF